MFSKQLVRVNKPEKGRDKCEGAMPGVTAERDRRRLYRACVCGPGPTHHFSRAIHDRLNSEARKAPISSFTAPSQGCERGQASPV